MTDLDLKLKDLDIFHGFIRRHIGPSPDEETAMLSELGMESLDELLDKVVPESIRRRKPLAVKASKQVCNRAQTRHQRLFHAWLHTPSSSHKKRRKKP